MPAPQIFRSRAELQIIHRQLKQSADELQQLLDMLVVTDLEEIDIPWSDNAYKALKLVTMMAQGSLLRVQEIARNKELEDAQNKYKAMKKKRS